MKLFGLLTAVFLITLPVANTKAISDSKDTDTNPLSEDSAALDSTLSRIQHLRRTLAALQNAGKAQKSAAREEKKVGDAKLKQASASARQAAVLMARASSLLKSEADLKSEQVRCW